MSRELHITREHNHLWIFASRLAGHSSPIEMRLVVDGHSVAQRPIPLDEQLDDPPPTIVDFSRYIGQTVNVEMVFRRRGEPSSFELLVAGPGGPPKPAAGE